MTIHLYIEHLLNIRTLSIQASLPTSSTQTTHASISADKSILTLTHNDETASIKLPINLSPRQESTITLAIPPVPQKELNFRVQLEEKEDSKLNEGFNRETGIITPWTADQLSSETEISCKSCGSVIVQRGTITQWKDLPSEGWAEMMDFWHCHKPDHPDGHAHTNGDQLNKGYAAGSRLAVSSGVGMVDALSFVFVSEDCSNTKTQETPADSRIVCANAACSSLIGSIDVTSHDGYSLHKPSLTLSTSPSGPQVSHEVSKWLSLLILTTMESQSVRKFAVHASIGAATASKTVKLWLFTPDLLVSTSALATNEPIRVSKILWQEGNRVVDDVDGMTEKLSRQSLTEAELSLRADETESLLSLLKDSAGWLPASSRKFGEWTVGLLKRFSQSDIDNVTQTKSAR